ncbi:hypothetical protein B0I37DRAFT_365975 [Chaetomium sp. MPI-CAGE-AT-0009]|nr:hypothetical protein B0I37DRAFT_365975 [Chaetomium sp. MPI-CAGE-AT-0009]
MKAFCILSLALPLPGLAVAGGGHTWAGWRGSHLNNHWAEGNRDLTSRSIASLSLHCKIPNPVGRSAPPPIRGNIAYYPTYNGSFIALNYKTCEVKWNIDITQVIADYAPITTLQLTVALAASRTSPQIDAENDILFFGTQIHALVVAADLDTGAMLGVQQANPHELAVITSSPTLHNSTLFVGVFSAKERRLLHQRHLPLLHLYRQRRRLPHLPHRHAPRALHHPLERYHHPAQPTYPTRRRTKQQQPEPPSWSGASI